MDPSRFQFERALRDAGIFDDFNMRVVELQSGAATCDDAANAGSQTSWLCSS